MKNNKTSIILIIFLMLLSCQDNLDLSDASETKSEVTVEKKIENGRFIFPNYELDFYGMAKRGSTWRGSRMVKIDE